MKKNIGLLIDTMNNGGAQRVVSRLSKILNDEYNIYVILFEDTFDSYECSGTLLNMNVKSQKNGLIGKTLQLIKRRKKLALIKKQYNLDVVISFLESPNFVNILSNNKKCKTVISIRNYLEIENSNSILGILINFGIKFLYNKADLIIPVSQVITDNLIEQYSIKREKIVTIYNPYQIESIQELSNEPIEKEYYKFMETGEILVSVGRQIHQKGFWHLVKSFKIVNDKIPDSKLVIVGRDEQDGKIKKLVNELGLQNQVLLVGYHNNPFKFIKKSKLYVLSSLYEGFPNAMVEAMACGCPVLSTDSKSGPREILYKNPDLKKVCNEFERADYGVLVPPFNMDYNWNPGVFDEEDKKMAEGIIFLLENKKILEHYCKKSLERAKHFSYEKCKKEFVGVIESK